MIGAIENNLKRGISLLENISDEEYSNTSIAPYYSSIGGHMRHILDVFDCIFEGLDSKSVNLVNRKRNQLAENYTKDGILYFDRIIKSLNEIDVTMLDCIVEVKDDLGMGIISANYTLGAALIQAHSHAIHHFASIGYVVTQLGIELPDEDFGFNPTTPKLTT
ncbi:DinB superfamily protein [Lutibacter oricola]|uniref:DinB superfamily protein n=1 Tax=Lutibacter oricola TaxID=762486 RepID=A0A1H3CBI0_9FLAO|nr:DinB family protein [Lutibacter oricola]SDX51552.1 DinB superfamily protein [Lutibacter oricola]